MMIENTDEVEVSLSVSVSKGCVYVCKRVSPYHHPILMK